MNERIEKAKCGVNEAMENLIGAYLETIREIYRDSDSQQGKHIQEGLEKFVVGLEAGKIPRVVLLDLIFHLIRKRQEK